jgi:hypothetical protein
MAPEGERVLVDPGGVAGASQHGGGIAIGLKF